MSKFLEIALVAAMFATPAAAEAIKLGRPALPEEVAAWDIDVAPRDVGLPEGSGDVATGEELFVEKCAYCHGDFGEGVDRWPVLAGGQGSLTEPRPVKTIGSYWPYLSTVWDYVHRAMPFPEPQSLSVDETYAITAYLLYVNDIVDEDFVLSKENFASIKLPNEDNFYDDDRDTVEVPRFSVEPCMENCKEKAEIVMRAAVLDVTPEDAAARKAREEAAARAAEGAETATAAAETATAAAPAESAEGEAAQGAIDPELAARGEKVFKKCKACHQVGEGAKNKTGPHLDGVVGRKAAAVEDFKYSSAMRAAAEDGLVWDAEALHAFLKKPKAFIKGTKMGFSGLKKDSDIDAVIEYLRQFGG